MISGEANECGLGFSSAMKWKIRFWGRLGGVSHAPMATPPLYASSDDARTERGGRPLRMGTSKRQKIRIEF